MGWFLYIEFTVLVTLVWSSSAWSSPLPWPFCPTQFFFTPPRPKRLLHLKMGEKTFGILEMNRTWKTIHFQVNHVEFRGCFFIYMPFFDSCLRIQRPKDPTNCFFFQGSDIGRIFFFAVFVHSDCIIFGYCQHMSNRYKFINIAGIMCISIMIDNVKLNEHANNASTLYMRM